MKSVLAKAGQISARLNALSVRERLLILIAVVVVLYQAWDSLVWSPLLAEEDGLLAQVNSHSSETAQTQAEIKIYSARLGQDPDKQVKQEIAGLQSQLAALDERINGLSENLIAPAEMAKLLEQLLSRQQGLRLMKLKTLASEPLLERKKTPGQQPDTSHYQIYRHAFVVEFEGTYLPTLKYLQELEKLPWKFFWDGVEYSVEKYPHSRVTLKLYTLSLSEGWIGV